MSNTQHIPFKLIYISLANWGRKEIRLLDHIGVKLEGPYKPDY